MRDDDAGWQLNKALGVESSVTKQGCTKQPKVATDAFHGCRSLAGATPTLAGLYFKEWQERAYTQMNDLLNEILGTKCPKCRDGKLVLRTGGHGNFIGCSNFPRKTPCTFTRSLPIITCPSCGKGYLYRNNPKFNYYICSNCDYETNYRPINQECSECGNYYIEQTRKGVIRCPLCYTRVESVASDSSG